MQGIDSLIDTAAAEALLEPLPALPIPSQPASYLGEEWMMIAGVLGILLLGLALTAWLVQGAANQAVAASRRVYTEKLGQQEINRLQAEQERLLTLLRTRDRHLTEYAAVLQLSPDHLTAWDQANWKAIARNTLALIQAVRPVVYADYRARIRSVSPTYGTLPGAALRALQEEKSLGNSLMISGLLEPRQAIEVEATDLHPLFDAEEPAWVVEPQPETLQQVLSNTLLDPAEPALISQPASFSTSSQERLQELSKKRAKELEELFGDD